MTVTQSPVADTQTLGKPVIHEQPKQTKPVQWFAGVGILFLALTVYEWIAWAGGGHAHVNPRRGPVPGWQLGIARTEEVLGPIAVVVFLYFFLWRPWRRERRVPLDGLLIIVFMQMWAMQDPFVDYLRPWSLYSTVWTNVGCPQCSAPGYLSAKTMSEPILFMWGAYVGALLGVVMIANTLMRWATRRWLQLTTARLIGLTFLFMCLMDFIMESIWLTTGAYTYGGAVRGLSLWAGHYYQFPVYEIVLFGAAWTAFACVRFFKNDRGETIAERGAAELGVKRMTPLRFLALIGIFNLIFLAYNVTVAVAGMYADNYPKDILNRPYLTGNVCGAYTNQACPGPQIPVPVGAKSGHVTPQGTFVAPNGLPIQVSNGH